MFKWVFKRNSDVCYFAAAGGKEKKPLGGQNNATDTGR